MPAIPARMTIAMTGSCRASAASVESSRNAANVARGLMTTVRARSHHSFWSDRADSTAVLMRPAYCLPDA
jgi:phage gp46-like protein